MSGGVDSSVTAALLRDRGYEVIGCFMRLGSPGEEIEPVEEAACETNSRVRLGKQGCCSVGDAADARLVAAELDIPFYVCNFRDGFGRIMDYFVDEYAAGRTPNPCVRCNDWLKFGRLHEYAERLGADFVASGHYARIVEGSGGPMLRRGLDAGKDQSYVLFGVARHQLSHMLLPIGELHKEHVRDLALRYGLPVFDKPDSQEICFVQGRRYTEFIEGRRPEMARRGPMVDEEGREVGEHEGQHRFTIGQRRVGVALGHPVYVVDKDPATNTVMVGSREALTVRGCVAREANWLTAPPEAGHWVRCLAMHRANGSQAPVMVRVLPDAADGGASTPSGRAGRFEVRFESPREAVAPGQAVVLYSRDEPDLVLGGGWIESVTRAAR